MLQRHLTATGRRHVALLAAAAAVTMAAPQASAEPRIRAGSIEISPMIGYGFFGSSENLDNNAYIALRGAYNATEQLAAEVSLSTIPTSLEEPYLGSDNDVTMMHVEADILFHLMAARFTPYVGIGGGMKIGSEPDFPPDGSTDLDIQIGYSLGLKYWAADWVALRLDGRHRLAFDRAPYKTEELRAEGGGSNFFNNLQISVGASFQLGGTPSDVDGDGVPDDLDKCPNEPEDKDGYQDEDGCVDPDNDSDGVLDSHDQCVAEPEDKDGFQDEDGCIDPDNDGDGILDGVDKCPSKAENKNGVQDDDGCPELDADGDGLVDPVDKCPSEPEDKDGFEDDDGCVDLDNDGDGIPDARDAAPDVPETVNGYMDEDGAPDEVPEALQAFSGRIEGIEFRLGSSALLPKSLPKLRAAVAALNQFPDLKVEVQGHTDNTGDAELNRKLSQERAEAVMKYLVQRGITAERVSAKGFGPHKPIDAADTDEARAKNRRVEFRVYK